MTATLPSPATQTGSVICNRGELLDALAIAASVIKTRTPKPILLCVRVTAANDVLTVSATNLEAQARCVCRQVQVEGNFDTVVNADGLFRIVREMSDDSLKLRFTGTDLEISGNDAKLKLRTEDATKFPPTPETETADTFLLPAKTLLRLVRQAGVGTDINRENHFASKCIRLAIEGKRVVACGTEGLVLAVSYADAPPKAKLDPVLIPLQVIPMLTRVLELAEEVAIGTAENRVFFDAGDVRIESNLLEGSFVPYEDVIPKLPEMKARVSREELRSKLKLSAMMVDSFDCRVRFRGSKLGLAFFSMTDRGETDVNLPCKFEGADIEIGINPKQSIGFLGVAETDEVTIELTAPNRPMLFRAGPDFLFVQMPMNLN